MRVCVRERLMEMYCMVTVRFVDRYPQIRLNAYLLINCKQDLVEFTVGSYCLLNNCKLEHVEFTVGSYCSLPKQKINIVINANDSMRKTDYWCFRSDTILRITNESNISDKETKTYKRLMSAHLKKNFIIKKSM